MHALKSHRSQWGVPIPSLCSNEIRCTVHALKSLPQQDVSLPSLCSNETLRTVHALKRGAGWRLPKTLSAAVIVTAAAASVAAGHQAVAAAAAKQDQQNDDPPAAVPTKAVVIAHKKYLRYWTQRSFGPLIPSYSPAGFLCNTLMVSEKRREGTEAFPESIILF